VLFGGRSSEHEASVRSSIFVIEHLNPDKYDLLPIGIDKTGRWFFFHGKSFRRSLKKNHLPTFCEEDPHFPRIFRTLTAQELLLSPLVLKEIVDLIFPVLHGPYGEDGTIQGLMQLADIPYVGSNVLSSAICMDKVIMKSLLRDAALPIVRYVPLHRTDVVDVDAIITKLQLPLFVKPANLGSSVGIHKVYEKKEFLPCVHQAFLYDEQVLIEENIEGREFECSVLGNFNPIVSLPGEIIPFHDFYSYKEKYLDTKNVVFKVPAKIDSLLVQQMQKLSLQAYKVLRCAGMARVDFFLKKNGKIFINELNTIPGFTPISLYPQLLRLNGVSYFKLIDLLIHYADECFERRAALKTAFP